MTLSLERYARRVDGLTFGTNKGRVVEAQSLVIESVGPHASLGEVCEILIDGRADPLPAEVVAFKDDRTLLMPLAESTGIKPGSEVVATGHSHSVPVGDELLGRVVDGLGRPMDGKGELACSTRRSVLGMPPDPLNRKLIDEPLPTRVRAIDAFLTCGRGQRLGIFSGSGVGKSTLLGKIARHSDADVNVIGLIGERNREVREFIDNTLGEEGLKRSVVVVATANTPALWRTKGAYVATTLAEHFRDAGRNVLLVVDSITRFALAVRQIGLAVGEPAASRGYTASVFAALPELLERAGTGQTGSVTGFYTVLVEGDDLDEPVSDAVRAILDGHIVLSRELTDQGHYPPIDILTSLSRLMPELSEKQHQDDALMLRSLYATYKQAEDMINIGAYAEGRNPRIDQSLKAIGPLQEFLKQDLGEAPTMAETLQQLRGLASTAA